MKIKPEHYKVLEAAILKAKAKLPSLAEYKANGLSDKRYRWDLLWASGLQIGDGKGMPGDLPLYAYMDDTHIDTALRRITGTK